MSSVSRLSPVEELADFLARTPSREEILAFRLSDAALDYSRQLMDKNHAGTITPDEARELDRLVLLDDILGLIRTRTMLSNSEAADHEQGTSDR